MSDESLYPSSIPCAFCEAPTALERHQVDDLSIGEGRCPNCRRLVLSVAGPSVSVHSFLDWLESIDYPKEQDVLPVPLPSRQPAAYRAAAFN
jgi:hypothetical protein